MKYAPQYLQSAVAFLQSYDGSVPLHHYLKQVFGSHKKYGSKDRRFISHLCYAYFRLGHALKNQIAEERIVIALYIAGSAEWQSLYPADWLPFDSTSLTERITFIQQQFAAFNVEDIFPFSSFSHAIHHHAFALSHLQQPKLFIRIRPEKENIVKDKLHAAGIVYQEVQSNCLAFKNNTKLEDVLELNKEYVVQDVSSQRVGALLEITRKPGMKIWDCCAASGGKSLLAIDLLPVKKLLVTDVRDSIIRNLKTRFKEAGIHHFTWAVADVTSKQSMDKATGSDKFDLVICDAPCSGSGTWGRTPEQLYFFTENKINYYSHLQKSIVANAIHQIAPGGYFLYITCSVFAHENEAVADYIQQQHQLLPIQINLLKGYEAYADTMFAALFKKAC